MTNGPSQEILLLIFYSFWKTKWRFFATAPGTLNLDTYGMVSPMLVPKTRSKGDR